MPSHEPPQRLPSVAQAARAPRGAPVLGAQVPTVAPPLQASHCPSQALLQQTPSTQKALPHSSFEAQFSPGARFGTQTPTLQKFPTAQSVFVVQSPRQPWLPQAKGAQDWSARAGHAPWPSQTAIFVAIRSEHDASRQITASPG
jgi:hypothetical protein